MEGRRSPNISMKGLSTVNLPNLEDRVGITFAEKPLLIGGMAMEYHGLRKAGRDIDFVLSLPDHRRLEEKMKDEGLIYLLDRHTPGFKEIPEYVDLYGDKGILFQELEIWTCILRFDYAHLAEKSIEEETCRVASLEKLLFMKALCIDQAKYLNDVELIRKRIISDQYR